MLVSNQWPAWIQNRNFAPRLVPNSVLMHYEGRAADLAPSDFDRSKIGALARLAVQAGFDWVHYEHKSHIHVSVKSDILSRSTRSLRCFPESSIVLLSNNRTKLLSEVQIGDEIAAFSTSTGRQTFSQVVSFLHVDRQVRIDDYLKIYIGNNYNLTVSPDHLIFVYNNDGSFYTKMAKNLIVGDFLILNNDRRLKISEIQRVPSRGLFAPLTMEGTIFVDNVAASCYAGVRSHDLADFVIRPIKYFWPNNNGRGSGTIHWYANFLWKIADLLESMNIYTFFDRDL
uniref:Protein hedgehog n=1 Tax=Romanomermis culicivorax TaxID=13658 RepID=A0A915LA40_ROMCU